MPRPKSKIFAAVGEESLVKKEAGVQVKVVTKDGRVLGEPPSLVKSILNVLNGGDNDSIERLAFEVDPTLISQYSSVYIPKARLLPDTLLKRIAIQDDLVAAIVMARCNQVSSFGRPRPTRFDTGYVIEANAGIVDKLDNDQKIELNKRIAAAVKKFSTCGDIIPWKWDERMTFSQYLHQSVRNAMVVGRLATEIIWATEHGEKKFHSFRPIDAGSIYRATPQLGGHSSAESIRKEAFHLLQALKSKKLVPEKFAQDEYAWIQVLEGGTPRQAFTPDECYVHNFYSVPDIELGGYPVTPLDTVISAVTTHINITTHNKLYFQSGRAARGMLIIKSEDVDESVVQRIRQQFNASINNVNNSWRMPVFGITPADDVSWQPIDNSSRDMEFQYLTDMNARVILSAFQMSPEELPGWSYLSRGTNSQALSESNNEFKLQAARDLGIRPLLSQLEDFINQNLFPLVDPQLAKICRFKFMGLEAETAEKESVRIQQDMPVHMTYNQVLEKVEKKPISIKMGGEFPLNPQFQQVLDKNFSVGEQLAYFCGRPEAAKDPSLAYYRDQFWMQWQQIQQQQAQMQQQMQMQQQQAAGGQGGPAPAGEGQGGGDDPNAPQPDGEGGASPDAGQNPAPETENQKTDAVQGASASPGDVSDLTRSLDQALHLLTKSEDQLPPSKRRLLSQHKKTVAHLIEGLDTDLEEFKREILGIAGQAIKK